MYAFPSAEGSPLVARRTVIEIVDVGLAFCRTEYATIVTLVLALYAPNILLKYAGYLFDLIPFDRVFNSFSFQETASYTTPNVLFMILDGLVNVLIQAALCVFMDSYGAGRVQPVMSCLEEAIRRVFVLARVSLFTVGAIALGLLACFVPGVVLYVLFLLTTPVVMIEKKNHLGAIVLRSRDLVAGEWWRVVGFLMLTWFLLATLGVSLTFLVSAGFEQILEQISWLSGLIPDLNWISMISGVLVSLMLFPLEMVFTMLLYFDIRSRREGLDLLVMVDRPDA